MQATQLSRAISIQAIFFDIGDTLVFDDPPLRERLTTAAHTAGVTLDPARLPAAFQAAEAFAVRRYIAGIPWDGPQALRETAAYLWDTLELPVFSDHQWRDFAGAFAEAKFTRHAHPEAKALLRELKQRGFVLGAISDWEDTLPDVLAELGLFAYFDALSISACVGVVKPGPRLFEDALRQVNFPPQACLHVGDWLELDVAGASAAGLHPLLFDWAERRPDATCPRVTTWAQLTEYLLSLPVPPQFQAHAGSRQRRGR
jgi:HAD superfamily hydrolase (TIGR01509 family)